MPDIPFVREHDFQYGQIEVLAPDIRRLTARNPSAFTYHGTGTYIIGTGTVAVIDPGPDDPSHLDALLSGLKGERISHILVTHCHKDHSPGARALQETCDAPTFAFGPHGFVPQAQDEGAEEGVDIDFEPDVRLAHGQRFDVGGLELECIHTPGHTSNHMCFALPAIGDVFSGDHVMAWSTSVIIPPDGNMADYLRSLQLMLGRKDRCYWPTHGPPLQRPHAYIEALMAHRYRRMDDILELLALEPMRIAQMVDPLYPGLDPRLTGGASRSILASLLYLIDDEKIASSGNTLLNSIYRRII